MADETCCWVVNMASGGQAGARLADALRIGRVGPVVDFRDPNMVHRVAASERVVACGGDGTVAAVLEAARVSDNPPGVGILPLGTGNDLAHYLGWSLLSSGSTVSVAFERYQQAGEEWLDRWLLVDPAGHARAWYNYCSWGLDARIAASFHHMRQRHPRWCRGRIVNKAMYAALSLSVTPARRDSGGMIDGLPHPSWARATVWLNIPRYAGRPGLGQGVRSDDGLVDGFMLGAGILSVLAIVGLRRPLRLGAHRACTVRFPHPTHLQIDGEPLLAHPGTWRILPAGRVRVLVPPHGQDAGCDGQCVST